MKILIFTEGTMPMRKSAFGHSREKIVRQAMKNKFVVKEFGRIDHLPDDITSFFR